MKKPCIKRALKSLMAGAFLMQASGCTQAEFNEFLQTVFLGITAAGAIVIIENV